MKNTQDHIEHYTFLYRLYLMLSIVALGVFACLVGYSYFTDIKESITMIDLFLLLSLFLLAFYLRINALHYHGLAVQLQKMLQMNAFQRNRQPSQPRRSAPMEPR